MAYEKFDWVGSTNGPLRPSPGATPISANQLDHLETQYDEAVDYVDAEVTAEAEARAEADAELQAAVDAIDVASLGAVPVTRTVAGKALSADVTLAKGDVGLGNVDNTSDANKPVSTATQTALAGKADVSVQTTVEEGRLSEGELNATIATQTERTVPDLVSKKSRPAVSRPNVPLVVFMDDDGRAPLWTTLRPLYAAQGIRASLAITTDLIGTASHLTWDQVRTMRDEGHEIVNHSKTHASLASADLTLARTEILDALTKFHEEGIYPEGYAYAQSTSNDIARRVVRDSHRYGLGGIGGGGGNRMPIWSYAIARTLINSSSVLATLKAQVDAYVSNPGILVYFTHSTDLPSTSDLNELIDYIQAAGVEIVTAGEAAERYANLLDVGDAPGAVSWRVIGPDGSESSSFPSTVIAPTGTMNSWLTRAPQDFTAGAITVFSVTNSQTTLPTPSQPATVTVNAVVTSNWAYVTQEVVDNESRIFRRRASNATTWGGWRHVGGIRSATTAELSSATSAVNTLAKQSNCLVLVTDGAPARYLQAASGSATGAWREMNTSTTYVTPA